MKVLFAAFILVLITGTSYCQEYADSLEQRLQDTYGLERLEVLNELTRHYTWSDSRKATRFGKQAQILAEDIFRDQNSLISPEQRYLSAKTLLLVGKAYYARGQYLDAQELFQAAKLKSEELSYQEGMDEADEYLAKIDSIANLEGKIKEGFIKSTFKGLNLSEKTSSSSTDFNISANLKLADYYEKNQNYIKAIAHTEKAINYLHNKGDAQRINELHSKIAQLYEKAGQYEEALAYYEMSIRDGEKIGDSATIDSTRRNMQSLYADINKITALSSADTAMAAKSSQSLSDRQRSNATSTTPGKVVTGKEDPAPNISPENEETESLRKLAQEFEEKQDFQKSLEYYKLYSDLNDKLKQEEQDQELALLENLYQIEQREIQITNLRQQQEIQNLELEEQKKFKNNLIIGAILLLSLAIALYLLYSNKRRVHKKLQTAYITLESTKNKLLDAEKRIKMLFTQQVSGAIANELLTSDESDKKIEKKFVCIMFLDIRGFTPFAEKMAPEEIIKYQNDVFGFMIEIIHKHQGIINQFLGDGFMATFGAPISTDQDCENAFRASTEIVEAVKQKSDNKEIPPTKVGIGLHAGLVVAGNVGTEERKQYSITGNTVIIASRIEQLTKEFDSNLLISEEVYNELKEPNGLSNDFQEVVVKGRSEPVRILNIA